MRFRQISTYHPPLERPDSIRSLVNDFRVVTWTLPPLSLETMLRCMRDGRARERYSDRCYGVGTRFERGVIDHAYAFKCDVGVFLLTMPYNTHEGFYKDFSSLMTIQANHFGCNPIDDIQAQIVNDRYKTRENGDFAAIIATIDVLDVLHRRMHSWKGTNMARIDFSNITESTGNGGLPNGPYVLKVVKASWKPKDNWGNDQTWAEFVFDVAEGPYADALDGRPDFAHMARLEFEDKKRLGILKRSLGCISRSNNNPNGAPFDAEAAFNALIDPRDPRHAVAPKAFEGKLFGGNVVQYHRPKQDGTDGTTEMVWTWYDAQEVRDGVDKKGNPIEPLEDQYKRGYTPQAAPQQQVAQVPTGFGDAQGVYDEDVPF